MIEKFKSLSKKNKCILGIIAVILFPITLIILASQLTINGFKDSKPVKTLTGIICILLMIGIIIPSEDTAVCDEEYQKIKSQLNQSNNILEEKNKKIEELEADLEGAKTYLSLSETDRETIDNEITNKKEAKVAAIQEENNQVMDDEPEVQKDNTVVKSYSSENHNNSNEVEEEYIEQPTQKVETSSGEVVYANGGSSKSNKYHSSPTAHNMEGAIEMSKSQAEASGYVPCGRCY